MTQTIICVIHAQKLVSPNLHFEAGGLGWSMGVYIKYTPLCSSYPCFQFQCVIRRKNCAKMRPENWRKSRKNGKEKPPVRVSADRRSVRSLFYGASADNFLFRQDRAQVIGELLQLIGGDRQFGDDARRDGGPSVDVSVDRQPLFADKAR